MKKKNKEELRDYVRREIPVLEKGRKRENVGNKKNQKRMG